MASRIGSDLRRARTRREIELSEVEAATKIRIRFLRAIESEEWDVLPGGVYTRSFIRTYASHLGLDGERLAEDYRREVEGVHTARPEVEPAIVPAAPVRRDRSPRLRLAWLAVPGVVLVGVLAILALPDGGGEDDRAQPAPQPSRSATDNRTETARQVADGLSVRLAASAEVWVCMLGADGEALVAGQILEPGAEVGPFVSGSFTVSFGNGEIEMLVDGEEADIPATSSPIGYAIDPAGRLTQLTEAERPTCT